MPLKIVPERFLRDLSLQDAGRTSLPPPCQEKAGLRKYGGVEMTNAHEEVGLGWRWAWGGWEGVAPGGELVRPARDPSQKMFRVTIKA